MIGIVCEGVFERTCMKGVYERDCMRGTVRE